MQAEVQRHHETQLGSGAISMPTILTQLQKIVRSRGLRYTKQSTPLRNIANNSLLQGTDATELLPSQSRQQTITARTAAIFVPPALGFGVTCRHRLR